MNIRRASRTLVVGMLLPLGLVPTVAGAEPRFEPDRTSEPMAHYQMIKHESVDLPYTDVVLDFETMKFIEDNASGYHVMESADLPSTGVAYDFETMKFIEDNTLGYHLPVAEFTQLDDGDTGQNTINVCQGEGLVSDDVSRARVDGAMSDYCSDEIFADFFGDRLSDKPLTPPSAADWPVGFGPY